MSINLSWNPEELDCVLVGITVTGFSGDDMVEIAPTVTDRVTTDENPQGATVRSYSASKLHAVTVNLMAGCPTDVAFRAALEAHTLGPCNIKSRSDSTQVVSPTSYVAGVSPIKFSRGHQMRTWVVHVPQARVIQS